MSAKEYLEFVLDIGQKNGEVYPVSGYTPSGDPTDPLVLPPDLKQRVEEFESVMLRGPVRGLREFSLPERPAVSADEAADALGRTLAQVLLGGDRAGLFLASLQRAADEGKGLRVVLRIKDPELVSLPWELAVDPKSGDLLAASNDTPLVRYTEQTKERTALAVEPPLRILGVIASPSDLEPLDVQREKERLEEALKALSGQGKVELNWLEQATPDGLTDQVRFAGPWHVLHFIGHGYFDEAAGRGGIVLCEAEGKAHQLVSSDLSMILRDHDSMRLVVLNACEGGRSGAKIFSSTAATLVRSGIPAVLAMQYPITDEAAKELSGALYKALAYGDPIDAAVSESRKTIKLKRAGLAEWGTPVLYMRSKDGRLFKVAEKAPPPLAEPFPAPAATPVTQAMSGGPAAPQPIQSLMAAAPAQRPAGRRLPWWGWALGALAVVGGGLVYIGLQTPEFPLTGVWRGEATSDSGNFQVVLDMNNVLVCSKGTQCGKIRITDPDCIGFLSLISENRGVYEFNVDRFEAGSSPDCQTGSGEFFRRISDTQVQYTTNYDNIKATLTKVTGPDQSP